MPIATSLSGPRGKANGGRGLLKTLAADWIQFPARWWTVLLLAGLFAATDSTLAEGTAGRPEPTALDCGRLEVFGLLQMDNDENTREPVVLRKFLTGGGDMNTACKVWTLANLTPTDTGMALSHMTVTSISVLGLAFDELEAALESDDTGAELVNANFFSANKLISSDFITTFFSSHEIDSGAAKAHIDRLFASLDVDMLRFYKTAGRSISEVEP